MRWIICKRVDYNTKLRIMHQAFGRVYKILENRDKKARKLLHIQQKIESPYDD
jgi:GTP1/Obg family GTP-binding protein